MPCDITLGRAEQCKNVIGGIRAVYLFNYLSSTVITVDGNDVIQNVSNPGDASLYKYELKGASTFEQTVTSSRENGSSFVEQKLTLHLKKLSIADHKQLKILSYGRPRIFVEDNNGNIFLAGKEKGMELTTSTISTGASMSDMSGYKLEFLGTEFIAANFILNNDIDSIGLEFIVVGTVA
jgi:hypothetical protein